MVVAQAGYVVPGPFRAWLEDAARAFDGELQRLAVELDVHEARVRRIGCATAGQTGLVKVETVDEWMTRLGDSIAELYGPLYGLPIPEKDGCGNDCFACGAPLREPALLCGFCMEEGGGS